MNYTELQAAIQNWAARPDSAVTSELSNIIGFCTDGFNHGIPQAGIAPLRVREMEETATITMSSGVGTLPTDYLQYIRVKSMAATPRPLSFVTGSYTDAAYEASAAGLSDTFSITGVSSINVFPPNSTDVELTYYAAIPALSAINTTNWLLTKLPALYLHAGLMHLALFTKDNNLLARSQALVTAMVDGLNVTDQLGTYAKAGTRMGMFTP